MALMLANEQQRNDKMVAEKATAETKHKAHCSQCGGIRNCDVRGKFNDSHDNEDISWCTQWLLLQCSGCEHVFVQTIYTNSEDYDQYYDHDGAAMMESIQYIEYWPALAKRKFPEWMNESGIIGLDRQNALNSTLLELYGALNNDLYMLAGIGIRTAFDKAAEQLGIDTEFSFEDKLAELVTRGHIGAVDKTRLEVLVDAGSASAHRGWKPTNQELNTIMDALEHFINDAFILPKRRSGLDERMQAIKKAVPPRPVRGKRKKLPIKKVANKQQPQNL